MLNWYLHIIVYLIIVNTLCTSHIWNCQGPGLISQYLCWRWMPHSNCKTTQQNNRRPFYSVIPVWTVWQPKAVVSCQWGRPSLAGVVCQHSLAVTGWSAAGRRCSVCGANRNSHHHCSSWGPTGVMKIAKETERNEAPVDMIYTTYFSIFYFPFKVSSGGMTCTWHTVKTDKNSKQGQYVWVNKSPLTPLVDLMA